ncbi:filamentous hemagglutinin N-terminal domain-containing protein, partial [Oleiagrimonas sp. C23AA]|uniref:beta strand repeat-containing protein n=1 Tax=Oleiagrimonas sp. C23AA TaxID=2719047 RepID=UPI00141F4B42
MINAPTLKVASLAAAIALAMGSSAAMAATTPPTANQLPGQGSASTMPTTVSNNDTVDVSSATGAVTTDADGNKTLTVTVGGNSVITWGGDSASSATINPQGTAGFNIGSKATVSFNAGSVDYAAGTSTSGDYTAGSTTAPAGDVGVLNVDASGNPSQIMGSLTAGTGVNLFVANENGVIVGSTATVSGTGEIGFIANKLAADQSGFSGTASSIAYSGNGGDVTVTKGADVSGTVMISGGSNVNVDLSAFTSGSVALSAGNPSAAAGAFAPTNDAASIAMTGDQGETTMTLKSAGDVSNTGALWLTETGSVTTDEAGNVTSDNRDNNVAGTFTNSGDLSFIGAVNLDGGLTNAKGATVSADGFSVGGDLSNSGTVTSTGEVSVGGDLSNSNTFSAAGVSAGGALSNDGQFTAGGDVSAKGALTNQGDFSASTTTGSGDTAQTTYHNVTAASIDNAGTFAGAAVSTTKGGFNNSGKASGLSGLTVVGGDITNDGTVSGTGTVSATATNGSITNNGSFDGFTSFTTTSNSKVADAADLSIKNMGTITSDGSLSFTANTAATGDDSNTSTGSFSNMGTLQFGTYGGFIVSADGDITAGGVLQKTNTSGDLAALSSDNALDQLSLVSQTGLVDVESALFTSGHIFAGPIHMDMPAIGATIQGQQVRLMADVTAAGELDIKAGAPADGGYSVRVASGVSVTADSLKVTGVKSTDMPNIILQGMLGGNAVSLGTDAGSVSDV